MKKLAALLVIPLALASYTPQPEAKPVTIKSEPIMCSQPVIEVEVAQEPLIEPEIESEPTSLGEFKLTAYCSCTKCCGKWGENRPVDEYGNELVYGATGEVLKAGYSVAVDPEVIPYGTELIINGETYKAMDCGGAINGNEIDVYFNDHTEALEFGVQSAEVKFFN